MSAKDAFFKAVKNNNEMAQSNELRVKEDINEYQRKTFQLSVQIQDWLDGSNVNFQAYESQFYDESVEFSANSTLAQYKMTNIRIDNNGKQLTLSPEGLYYFGGSKGKLVLTIDNPSRSPRQTKFSLWMQKESNTNGWSISEDKTNSSDCKELTEEVFFQTISQIA